MHIPCSHSTKGVFPMNFNTISSVVIYGFMLVFLYACINPGRMGLIRLHRLSKDLRSAADQLKSERFCLDLVKQILNGTPTAADSLFSTKVLSEQMWQYCSSVYFLVKNKSDKCRPDIDEYINYDLLHQQGRVDLCEHTISGFTALGLLGTFLGVAFGLNSLNRNGAQQIIVGIDGLLDGMDLAFLTSIVGIVLSLALGTAMRLILAAAESNLELFLTLFRSNVMRNQSEAALNEIIQNLISINKRLDTSNDLQVDALNRTVSAFINKLNNDLGLQIGVLRSAIQDMSSEQSAHNSSVKNLTTQMNHMSNSLKNVSNSFLPVLTQSTALSQQFDQANQSLKSSIDEIHKLLKDDAAALEKHHQLQSELMRTATAMEHMTASIQAQTAELSRHHQAIFSDHQKALNHSLTQFAAASKAVSDELYAHSTQNLATLQNNAQKLIDNMPQNGVSIGMMHRLLEQNQALIDQQAKLIRIMEDKSRKPVLRLIRRTKK